VSASWADLLVFCLLWVDFGGIVAGFALSRLERGYGAGFLCFVVFCGYCSSCSFRTRVLWWGLWVYSVPAAPVGVAAGPCDLGCEFMCGFL